MADRTASSLQSNLLSACSPEVPSLNEKQFSHHLKPAKPALVPLFKSAPQQSIDSRKLQLASAELPASNKDQCQRSSRKHQFHFWLGKKDFLFLQDQAQEEGESVARIIRRLIREFRINAESRPSGNPPIGNR